MSEQSVTAPGETQAAASPGGAPPPPLPMDIIAIQRVLPHRYPFLLVDRVVEYTGERCVALKNVTINEPFFTGHFPGNPVMPGVLQIEAMAQASALHAALRFGRLDQPIAVYLATIDRAKFRRPVVPGDQLSLVSTLIRGRGKIWKFRGEVLVDGQLVSEAEYMATLPPGVSGDGDAPEAGT
jgi:3-hydroxyacyl-[acyl-carrier-protein] dehydratase